MKFQLEKRNIIFHYKGAKSQVEHKYFADLFAPLRLKLKVEICLSDPKLYLCFLFL